MSRLLLCTDLDRTLLPNGEQAESAGARARFQQLADREDVDLVFVTGRDRALVTRVMDEYALPQPDWVIGDVGTTLYECRGDDWRPWAEWAERIGDDWGGSPSSALAAQLQDVPGLRLQAPEKQNRHKISFHWPLTADVPALETAVQERLAPLGIRTRLVWSVDEPAGLGLLDVLPFSASKLHALRALMTRVGTSPAHTVFCGDSGNDLEVLVSDIPSVLVANAAQAVREQALAESRAGGTSARLYLARGGFLGMNGHYAAGILEGVAHHHPGLRAWMEDRWGEAA